MRLFANTKGQDITTSKVFYWLFGLAIAVFLVFSVWGFGETFFLSLTKTPDQLTEDLFIARIINTCFSWNEQTTPLLTETHPSILDLSKITSSRLATCFTGEKSVPFAVVDVKPLRKGDFSSRRALLHPPTFTQPIEQRIAKQEPQLTPPRYVLVKGAHQQEVCNLKQDAITLANAQGDKLFFSEDSILSEQDFSAIETYLKSLAKINNGSTSSAMYLFLSLDIAQTAYNMQPTSTDFCYSKTGSCTYEDFITDYKGDCQTQTITTNLYPATIQVTFYD